MAEAAADLVLAAADFFGEVLKLSIVPEDFLAAGLAFLVLLVELDFLSVILPRVSLK